MGSMTPGRFVTITAFAASVGCGADTATQPYDVSRQTQAQHRVEPAAESSAVVAVPQSPADRNIRRELNLAIARDPDLKAGEISFIVTNGDVNVTGVVQTEAAREKINELALGIPGVKSVANGLRVAP
jgi:hyperosmotically inducible protein